MCANVDVANFGFELVQIIDGSGKRIYPAFAYWSESIREKEWFQTHITMANIYAAQEADTKHGMHVDALQQEQRQTKPRERGGKEHDRTTQPQEQAKVGSTPALNDATTSRAGARKIPTTITW